LGGFQKGEVDKNVLRKMKQMKHPGRYSTRKYTDEIYKHNSKVKKLTRSK